MLGFVPRSLRFQSSRHSCCPLQACSTRYSASSVIRTNSNPVSPLRPFPSLHSDDDTVWPHLKKPADCSTPHQYLGIRAAKPGAKEKPEIICLNKSPTHRGKDLVQSHDSHPRQAAVRSPPPSARGAGGGGDKEHAVRSQDFPPCQILRKSVLHALASKESGESLDSHLPASSKERCPLSPLG